MNWLDNKGAPLRLFCEENELKNFVYEPTRIVTNKGYSSRTLIDVVLHNGLCIDKTMVIDFPFSDQRMVLTECKFQSAEETNTTSIKKMSQ